MRASLQVDCMRTQVNGKYSKINSNINDWNTLEASCDGSFSSMKKRKHEESKNAERAW